MIFSFLTEKYSRGRRGAPAKGVGWVTAARVQIPLSPPNKNSTQSGAVFIWRRKSLSSRRLPRGTRRRSAALWQMKRGGQRLPQHEKYRANHGLRRIFRCCKGVKSLFPQSGAVFIWRRKSLSSRRFFKPV